ncbi:MULTISPECIES: hypothetical protein [unclassified Mesorhizobium]|nr:MULTISPECIES: hypothetical protein [unclassified Mesorhizobium]WFP60895.1 hypothetical protein QAZ47_20600 [Mesorhizobium sp. WSM4904]WFP74122.1 hypothetical protein QAZ22_20505 [Mesorhizobium sp. WSM4906]
MKLIVIAILPGFNAGRREISPNAGSRPHGAHSPAKPALRVVKRKLEL